MRSFIFGIYLMFSFPVFSQVKVYIGQQKFISDLIYAIENNIAYRYVNPAQRSECLFLDQDKVYFKNTRSYFDVKYTVQQNRIYKGNSTSSFDALFTVKNGKVYTGTGEFSSLCLYTLVDGLIYKGDSTSAFDVIMSYEIEKESDLMLVVALILPY